MYIYKDKNIRKDECCLKIFSILYDNGESLYTDSTEERLYTIMLNL